MRTELKLYLIKVSETEVLNAFVTLDHKTSHKGTFCNIQK